MEDRIKNAMASILGIETSTIDEESSPETVAEWDSLKHVLLVIALEKEFHTKFTPREILQLTSYRAIRTILKSRT